jgi:hypothetical protein
LLRLTSTLDRGTCGHLLDDPVCEQADALDLDLDEIVWRDQDRRRPRKPDAGGRFGGDASPPAGVK